MSKKLLVYLWLDVFLTFIYYESGVLQSFGSNNRATFECYRSICLITLERGLQQGLQIIYIVSSWVLYHQNWSMFWITFRDVILRRIGLLHRHCLSTVSSYPTKRGIIFPEARPNSVRRVGSPGRRRNQLIGRVELHTACLFVVLQQ